MKNKHINSQDVKGWGIDRDKENDPTYPIKKRLGKEHKGYNWKRPTQQKGNVEILRSIERPNLSAVYGTSVPPKGLSGIIRRWAFKKGEASFGHWVPLILADRINSIEGIISDIGKGKMPNIPAEKGYNAQWKYNRKGLIKKLAVTALVAGAAFALAFKSGRKLRS